MSRQYLFEDQARHVAFERDLLTFYDSEHAALVQQYKRNYERKVRAGRTPAVPPSFGLDEILKVVAPKIPARVRPYLAHCSVCELNRFIEAVAMTAYDYEMGFGEVSFKMTAIYMMLVKHLPDCYPVTYSELAGLHMRRYELLKRERALRTDIADNTASLERGVVEMSAMSKQLAGIVQQGLSLKNQIESSRQQLEDLLLLIGKPSYPRSEWIRIKALREKVQLLSFERMVQAQSKLAENIVTLEARQQEVITQVDQHEKRLICKRSRLEVLRGRNKHNYSELEEVRKQMQCIDATLADVTVWLGKSERGVERLVDVFADRATDACLEAVIDGVMKREDVRVRAVEEFLASVVEAASQRAAVVQHIAHQLVERAVERAITKQLAAEVAEQAVSPVHA